MPASDPDERRRGPGPDEAAPQDGTAAASGPTLEEELAALEESLGRLLEEHGALKKRLARLERTQRTLGEALAVETGEEAPAGAVERLRELAEENRRLLRIVEEGRERAERLRSRLILMEDDLS